jgi:hypothetical protein
MENLSAQEMEFERKENEYLKFQKELNEGKQVVAALTDYVNHNRSTKGFIEAFKREHRTLQQSAFKLMLALMEEIASENYHYDGRNESSHEVAKTIMKGFKMAKKEEYIKEGVSEERAENYVSGEGEKPSRYLPLI